MAMTGRCLCGAVAFRLPSAPSEVSVCHCGLCRRQAAGPVMAVHGAGQPEITGTPVWFRSSDWGERGFCGTCGAALFWRITATGETVVSAHALDDAEGLRLESHIFVDAKPAFYDFADDAPRLTEAEFLATLGAPGEAP